MMGILQKMSESRHWLDFVNNLKDENANFKHLVPEHARNWILQVCTEKEHPVRLYFQVTSSFLNTMKNAIKSFVPNHPGPKPHSNRVCLWDGRWLVRHFRMPKLPTYPSLKPTFLPYWEVSVNGDLGVGKASSFPETYNDSFAFGNKMQRKSQKQMWPLDFCIERFSYDLEKRFR